MPLRLSRRGLRQAMWLTLVVTVLSLTATGSFAAHVDTHEPDLHEPADVPEPHEDDAPDSDDAPDGDDATEPSGPSIPSEDQTAPAQEDATADGPAPTSLGGPPVVLSNGSFVPSCEEGYVYNLRSTGLIQQIDPNGVVSDFGDRVTFADGTSFNALGIGADGQGVFALSWTG